MIKKTKIIYYSGHGDIVGGDAKYFLELISNLDQAKYDIEVFTDKNYLFEKRAKKWLSRPIAITYLDTRPVIFKKDFIRSFYGKLLIMQNKNLLQKAMLRTLNIEILKIELYRWIAKIFKIFSFDVFRDSLHNAFLFYRLLKSKRKDTDIFHFNNGGYPGKHAGIIAVITAKIVGIKNTVMTLQNLPWPRKFCSFLDYATDALIGKYCSRIISVSEDLRKKMNARRRFPLERIVTIYHGLSDSTQHPKDLIIKKKSELNLPEDAPLLLITANLEEDRKGHSILFKSLIEVKRYFPDVILLVVGNGSKKQELMALRNNYGLEENIAFLGHRDDIDYLNNIIDIAIVPSIGFEGLPYTIREAMRAGKPVITTDAGGCAEAVENNVNGIVVNQNNSEELSKAIITLLGNKTLRDNMGKEGRRIFKEKFLLSQKILEHQQLYDELITHKK